METLGNSFLKRASMVPELKSVLTRRPNAAVLATVVVPVCADVALQISAPAPTRVVSLGFVPEENELASVSMPVPDLVSEPPDPEKTPVYSVD
jgi:hypothetical protein